jgi:excisionase family DNA binding protein
MSLGGSNKLLTPEDVAEYLSVPKKTIYDRWREWGLRGIRVGRHLRFRERTVEDFLNRNVL